MYLHSRLLPSERQDLDFIFETRGLVSSSPPLSSPPAPPSALLPLQPLHLHHPINISLDRSICYQAPPAHLESLLIPCSAQTPHHRPTLRTMSDAELKEYRLQVSSTSLLRQCTNITLLIPHPARIRRSCSQGRSRKCRALRPRR